jgi:hypothetical protein
MLAALGAVVMPFDWMNSIHQQLGLGSLPNVPIVGYLTRSISTLYALHGALLIFLATRRYLPVVRFLAVTDAVFGALMLGIDWAVGMPLFGLSLKVTLLRSACSFFIDCRKRFRMRRAPTGLGSMIV